MRSRRVTRCSECGCKLERGFLSPNGELLCEACFFEVELIPFEKDAEEEADARGWEVLYFES